MRKKSTAAETAAPFEPPLPISTPASKQMSVPNVADRAAGYGIPGLIADGTDVLDASVLLMPLTKFIAPTDPKTYEGIGAVQHYDWGGYDFIPCGQIIQTSGLSFMMDVPHARQQMGSAVGVRHRAGQSETPAPE